MTTSKRNRSTVRATGMAVGAFALAAGGFFAGSALASPAAAPTTVGGERAADAKPYPRNQSGLTYGTETGGESGDWPDLVLVGATNGKAGYVYRDELEAVAGGNVTSPKEALAWQRQQEDDGWDVKYIPVYSSDGRTQIGEHEIQRTEGEILSD